MASSAHLVALVLLLAALANAAMSDGHCLKHFVDLLFDAEEPTGGAHNQAAGSHEDDGCNSCGLFDIFCECESRSTPRPTRKPTTTKRRSTRRPTRRPTGSRRRPLSAEEELMPGANRIWEDLLEVDHHQQQQQQQQQPEQDEPPTTTTTTTMVSDGDEANEVDA